MALLPLGGCRDVFTVVGPAPGISSLSGNWQFKLTPSRGGTSGETASGSIDEGTVTYATGQFTTSVLIVKASCFNTTPVVPLQGSVSVDGTTLTLASFIVNGQFLSLTSTASNSGTNLQGTYEISGGCADGEQGSIQGTRIPPVVGTYTAVLSGTAPRTMTAALSQSTQSNGDGNFLLSGTSTFTGFTCFRSGSILIPGSGLVSGTSLRASFVTDEAAGSTVLVTGTTTTDVKQVPLTYQVRGGACSGQTGSGTAVLQ